MGEKLYLPVRESPGWSWARNRNCGAVRRHGQQGQAELVESNESLSVPAGTAHNLAFTISRLSPEAFDVLIGGDRSGGAISDGVGHLATELGSDVSDGIDTGDIGFHSVVGEDVTDGV